MNAQHRPHPRAGIAIGALLLAGWVGAIGAAIATDDAGGSSGASGAGPAHLAPGPSR
jgi:hypothetical protein